MVWCVVVWRGVWGRGEERGEREREEGRGGEGRGGEGREWVGRGGGGGVVVVRTVCMTKMFIHERQRMHRIGVTEHLGVRLPASPPPGALNNQQLLDIEG